MFKHYLLLILTLFATFICNAATYTNNIVFIENNIDNEYFITPQKPILALVVLTFLLNTVIINLA